MFRSGKDKTRSFGKVAVLMGGRSAERAVSLAGGQAVLDALLAQGVDAFAVDCFGEKSEKDVVGQLQTESIDTVFNMLHGGEGENGTIPALLKLMGVPFTGSSMASCALAMDKVRCKYLWAGMDLPTPAFVELKADTDWHGVIEKLGLPLIVKPAHEGSSIGMSKVDASSKLPEAYELAARYDKCVIAERWVTGPEFTVAVLNGRALPAIRLETKRDFYDYQAKYIDDDTSYQIPCGLDQVSERRMQKLSLDAFNSLGCKGWGRVDLMQDREGQFWLLEVNTVPGMTSHSLVPMAAQAAGMSFETLVMDILETASVGPGVGR